MVLLAHGLNLRPDKMDSLGRVLGDAGARVLRLALAGHRGSLAELKRVRAELWRAEVQKAVAVARARAAELSVPLFLVAFSLGAPLALTAGEEAAGGAYPFDRAVLLAPALALRPRVRLVDLLGILGSDLVLPSLTPPAYRANPGTSIAAYRALFDLERSLRHGGLSRADVPTLVFIDPDDELVSYAGLLDRLAQERLRRWRVEEVSVAGSTLPRPWHHLIIDEPALGAAEWRRVCAGLLGHLDLPAPPRPAAAPGRDRQ